MSPNEIELVVAHVPDCRRCDGPGLLMTRFAKSLTGERGQIADGYGERVLCQNCDATDPAAAELLALFAVDERVGPAGLDTLAELAGQWTDIVSQRTPDLDQLEAEAELWRRGEL